MGNAAKKLKLEPTKEETLNRLRSKVGARRSGIIYTIWANTSKWIRYAEVYKEVENLLWKTKTYEE